MPVNDNTNRLGTSMRLTARQFDSPTASRLSAQISRQNLRTAFRTDPRMARVRVYVRKMVASFTTSEKMAILAQFGDPRRDSSDEAVVEALIVSMKQSELDTLVNDISADEAELGKKVREIRRDKKRAASKFSAGTFEDLYSKVKGARNSKQIRKALSAYDKSFKVPKAIYSQYGNLKREIERVLRDIYNRVELSGLAIRMGIEFTDDINQKQLVGLIVNKVLLFVSLVMGKTKGGYSNAIIDDAPYKEILQYTSYSWAAGVVGKSSSDLSRLQKDAREAKARSRETFVQKDKPGRGFVAGVKRFAGGTKGAVKGGLAGAIGAGLLGSLIGGPVGLGIGAASALSLIPGGLILGGMAGSGQFRGDVRLQKEAAANVSRTTVFKDSLDAMDPQQLFDEAAKYGLKPRKDLNALKRDIRIQIEKKRIRIARLESEKAKASKKGRLFNQSRAAELAVLKSDIKEIEQGSEEFQGSSKIPYLTHVGGATDTSKLKAVVPVFVVNSMSAPASTAPSSPLPPVLAPAPTAPATPAPAASAAATPQSPAQAAVAGSQTIAAGPGPNQLSVRVTYGGKSANAATLISEAAISAGLSKRIKKEPVTPVYIVNKSPLDVITRTEAAANAAKDLLKTIVGADGLPIKLATGGVGRAAGLGRKTTHFISGDSLSKRPNPEQVSINWSDKSYSVKPIPQFAEGGGQSPSGQIRRMTPGERSEPMKVYAVNNNLTEMVEVNGQSVSLIGLVSEMNGRLGTIEGLLAIGNRNSEAIVRSTALTATSIGRVSAPQSGSNGMNPFANGFPSDLNPILSGV